MSGLSIGWAIGTDGWRQSLAKHYRELALAPGLDYAEVRDLRERNWEETTRSALSSAGRNDADLSTQPRRQPWKLEIALSVRRACGAPWAWLANRLQLGSAVALRSYACRLRA